MFSNLINQTRLSMPNESDALPGRQRPIPTALTHYVNGRKLKDPYPDNMKTIIMGMGCFWGVERLFWDIDGVYVTATGYSGGFTPNPTYEEVCSCLTGHTEAVLIVYDPEKVSLQQLLKIFWEEHNPTQAMRQGNDIGNNYRSALYLEDQAALSEAIKSRDNFQRELDKEGLGKITTDIEIAGSFYFAEDYHQQYLAKNPNGYCGLKGTGVSCPINII